MSLILDALNRSQDERRGQSEVPGLETRHYPAPEEPRGTRSLLLAALLGVALLLGLVAYLLLSRETSPAQPVAQPQARVEAPAVPEATVEELAPAEAAAVLLPAPGQAAGGGNEVAALYSQAAEPEAAARVEAEPETARPLEERAVAPPAQAEEVVDLEEMVAIAEQEMQSQRLQEHDAPFLSDLSQQRKDAIPTLLYSRHDYAGDARRSLVVINGKTLRAGSQVAPGIRLDEILPDSAVFSFRGEQFRLAALNSWVNL